MRLFKISILMLVLAGTSLMGSGVTARPTNAPEMATIKGVGPLFGLEAGSDITVEVDRDPIGRVQAWAPQDPGVKKWITLDYGPYTIGPGSDLSRLDAEIVGQQGFAVGFEPSVVDATGEPYNSHDIHIHHAHWTWLDPEQEGYHRWFYGTGEERTQGSLWDRAKKDPRFKDGLRYGVELQQGDRLGFISMLHNKTAEQKVVYLRVRMDYVYGSHDSIQEATDWDIHNLRPTLIGTTFNVPHTGDTFVFPQGTTEKNIGPHSNYHNPVGDTEVVPGVGQVVTIPFSGMVIAGAGHMHPGGTEVVLSNLGRKDDPCPEDGDDFPGTTMTRSRNIARHGVFGSEQFQMGVTPHSWRMYVREGDRLVLNGVYDASDYGFLDAMSYYGFYTDTDEPPTAAQACTAELIDKPGASAAQVVRTVTNQAWPHHDIPTCDECNEDVEKPEPGSETNVVHIAGFQYLPGNIGFEGPGIGPPVVAHGDEMQFINEDYALGAVRHSVTSCKAPCNGPYVANFPLWDGGFHSGALGFMWEETYINARSEPVWTFDTSELKRGWHTYFCQLHPWMRGSFYIK